MKIIANKLYQPIIIAEIYLLGGFALFLLGPGVQDVEGLALLISFVLAVNLALFFGYRKSIKKRTVGSRILITDWRNKRKMKVFIFLGALYFTAYGIAMLIEYGASDLGTIISTIKTPGQAYFNKFEVYERQLNEGTKNHYIQILVLLSALYAFLIPYSIALWKELKPIMKLLVKISIAIYISFFLFTGTMKGLGDVCLISLASYACTQAIVTRSRNNNINKSSTFKKKVLPAFIIGFFITYMAFNMFNRLEINNQYNEYRTKYDNSFISNILGPDVGIGLNMVILYPTHGYIGLSRNLNTPFKWTYGLGSSFALNSYFIQYLGATDMLPYTYLVRTESRTGWPALRKWATIYPWLASDLTFPGTIFFMYGIGYFLAKVWYEGAFLRNPLSMVIFTQLCLLIGYIPANNQLFHGRSGLWCTVGLLFLYFYPGISRRILYKPVQRHRFS